jgi:hypothetical protein
MNDDGQTKCIHQNAQSVYQTLQTFRITLSIQFHANIVLIMSIL